MHLVWYGQCSLHYTEAIYCSSYLECQPSSNYFFVTIDIIRDIRDILNARRLSLQTQIAIFGSMFLEMWSGCYQINKFSNFLILEDWILVLFLYCCEVFFVSSLWSSDIWRKNTTVLLIISTVVIILSLHCTNLYLLRNVPTIQLKRSTPSCIPQNRPRIFSEAEKSDPRWDVLAMTVQCVLNLGL